MIDKFFVLYLGHSVKGAFIFFPGVLHPNLSVPQPEFKSRDLTYKHCLLLHRLIVQGHEEVVLRNKDQLCPSILSHNFKNNFTTRGGFKRWATEVSLES